MIAALNSPIETGVRMLCLLAESHPVSLGLNQLVLLDHALLHSADLDGPPSLHPPLPSRVGELGMKRTTLEIGIKVLLRSNLANLEVGADGFRYQASDGAGQFIGVMESAYVHKLRLRAQWVVNRFGNLDELRLRAEMRSIFDSWSEEFDSSLGSGE